MKRSASRRPVVIAIEQIVLDGMDLVPHQLGAFRHSLENELAGLIRTRGMKASQSISTAAVAAPTLQLSAGAGVSDLGRTLARSVFEVMESAR